MKRGDVRCAADSQPLLKIFQSGGEEYLPHGGNGLSPEMSLVQFFRGYIGPICLEAKGAADATLWEYGRSVGYWRDFTGDPPLKQIDQYTCAEFVTRLSQLPGRKQRPKLSVNTVRKHCRQIQFCLDRTGPAGRENRQGTDLLQRSPWIEQPRKWMKPAEDSFTLEEIGRWLGVCDQAQYPHSAGITPAAWWSALIRFLCNVGVRIGAALQLRWEMIQEHWLVAPAEIMKRHQGWKFWINQAAAEALESIRCESSSARQASRCDRTPRPLIFPWPHKRRQLDRVRERLLEAAGIPRHRWFGFQGLRKALASILAEKNPLVAQMQLGHAGLSTTKDHYVHPGIVAAVMEQIPQPDPQRIDPQLRLF